MQEPRARWVGGWFFLRHSSAPSEILKAHKDPADLMDAPVGKKSFGGGGGVGGAFPEVLTTPPIGLNR